MDKRHDKKAQGINSKPVKQSSIESTFLYGPNMKQWKIIVIIVSTSIFVAIGMVGIVATIVENNTENLLYLFVSVLFVPLGIATVVVEIKHKRKINGWLKDAVVLIGTCDYAEYNFTKIDGSCKIAITFECDGKELVRTTGSQNYHPLTWTQDGHQKIFRKYVGKNIKILYSPTYDEIMIPYQQ